MTEILTMPQSIIAATALEKAYQRGHETVPVLKGVNMKLQKGEFLSITGKSGSGKSTLLHLLGLLDAPDVGEVHLHEERIDDLPPHAIDQLRNRVFGFIFQFYHLLPEMTLLENVLTPLMIRHSIWDYWKQRKTYIEQAKSILEDVGLGHRLKHRPTELSGGEMQRGAIARALISQPEVLLADEPTGNLDPEIGQEILNLLIRLNQEQSLTIVMVTHDEGLAKQADRSVLLEKGLITTLDEAA